MTGRSSIAAIWVAIAVGTLAVTGARTSGPTEVLLGDANGDGRVNRADFEVFNAVVYQYRRIPLERVRALDLDEDGDADLDDLGQLLMDIRDREPARRELRPAAPPRVVFRDLYSAGLPPLRLDRKLQDLEDQMRASSRGAFGDAFQGFDATRELIRDFERYRAEVEAAIHYELIGGKSALLACNAIEWERPVFEAARQVLRDFRARRPEGRDYIETCERMMRAAPGGVQTTQVRSVTGLCWRYGVLPHGFFYQGRFQLGLRNNRLTLELPIGFRFAAEYEGHPDRQARDEARVAGAMRCVQDWWSQYGVDFRFRINDGAELTIHEGNGRANSGNLYLGTDSRDSSLCSTLAHEIGHRLGLPDEYEEPTELSGISCGQDRVRESDSLMSQEESSDLWRNRLYPRHLRAIFGRVCGPYR